MKKGDVVMVDPQSKYPCAGRVGIFSEGDSEMAEIMLDGEYVIVLREKLIAMPKGMRPLSVAQWNSLVRAAQAAGFGAEWDAEREVLFFHERQACARFATGSLRHKEYLEAIAWLLTHGVEVLVLCAKSA